MPADTCRIFELSLDRALRYALQGYSTAYRWYLDHMGAVGPLPYGRNQPANMPFRMAAQRGIHKPGGEKYALCIHSNIASTYNDQLLFEQDDGTWLYYYAEHQNSKGNETSPTWNNSLIKCMFDGFPVAVYVQLSPGVYENKGLAFVEAHDTATGLFTLHGPVTYDQPNNYWNFAQTDSLSSEEQEIVDKYDSEIEYDERKRQTVESVIRKGQSAFRQSLIQAYDNTCAITGCTVGTSLQAAHISSYRGPKSQQASNGLLLRADIHLLYDAHLLSIEPDTCTVVLSDQLRNTDYDLYQGEHINTPVIHDDQPSLARLRTHYSCFRISEEDRRVLSGRA